MPVTKDWSDKKILHVEDDLVCKYLLSELLTSTNVSLTVCSNLIEARKRLTDDFDYDLVLLDILLPDGLGVKLCENIYNINPDIPVIVNTAYYMSERDARLAVKFPNVKKVLMKPTSCEDILDTISCYLDRPTYTTA